MRILYVIQSLIMGGAERLTLEIANELTRRDLAEVLIVAFGEEHSNAALSAKLNCRVCPIRFNLSVLKKNDIDISSLLQAIREFKPDIIHTHGYMQEAPPREIIDPGIAYFTHLHYIMPEFAPVKFRNVFSKKEWARNFEKRRLFRHYHRAHNYFIAISKDIHTYFNHSLPADLGRRICFMPNAIDYKKFLNKATRSIDGTSPIKLINVGRFDPVKNQIFLIQVIHHLKRKGVNVLLECIGNLNDQEEIMKNEIGKYGLTDHIKLLGMRENVQDYLKRSDIYVHSARYESFGLVFIEAMASGLPVVCLDGKGNRDIIEEGKNGFMVHQPDPEEFAEKIIRLIEDPLLYRSVSDYARDYAARFDIGPYTDRLLELYREAINKTKPHQTV
jgi:glycosyltransferase involved in cell wall biosynthesis